jgi:DNA-binding transcriptional MerR regulator
VSALPQGRTPAPVGPPTLSIGQVLSRLAEDFPELSPSKLRFLEDRGLIQPARTASGYRSFAPTDIERIKLVLLMQRDHYLPLKVIRRYLADLDAGKNPAWPGTAQGGGPSMLGTERRYSRDELLAESGGSAELLNDAVSAGLLPAAEIYGEDEAAAMKALTDLASTGIEPRHLRAMRIAAEREIELIGNALLPMRRRADGASRARADLRAVELAGQLEVVRARLVKAALAKQTA